MPSDAAFVYQKAAQRGFSFSTIPPSSPPEFKTISTPRRHFELEAIDVIGHSCLTIENAGHAPWIEAPDVVLRAIDAFFDGKFAMTVVCRHSSCGLGATR